MKLCLSLIAMLCTAVPAPAETLTLAPQSVTEWKAIYGEVQTRDTLPARARIGGTITDLLVTEGDHVAAGQRIAMIEDDKLAFQIDAFDARLGALHSQLDTAETDLRRGEDLKERGVITTQRLDQLRTQVDVLRGEISGVEAERLVIEQRISEGGILAPGDGVVLSVPLARGSVVTPGEGVAVIGGGGVFLRLSVPERHATALVEGDPIEIGGDEATQTGLLAKIYPLIEGGRVQADVEVAGLDGRFVGRRVEVRLPVGERQALLVPENALHLRGGIDFIKVEQGETVVERAVVPGANIRIGDVMWREIVSGLAAGDVVVIDDE